MQIPKDECMERSRPDSSKATNSVVCVCCHTPLCFEEISVWKFGGVIINAP